MHLSVDLHVVALRLLHALGELLPLRALLLRERTEALLHAALHALQPAHVDVGLRALHQLPQLIRELGHLRLDVHLLPRRVLLLLGDMRSVIVFSRGRNFSTLMPLGATITRSCGNVGKISLMPSFCSALITKHALTPLT